jgi:phage shock protein PspC (stress-responsive transcriptional regulator)
MDGTADAGPQNSSGSTQRSGLDKVFDLLRGLGVQRRRDHKWLGGVCSGLADRMGVDPLIVRAGLVLLGLLFGFGVTLYLLAWVLLPDTDGAIPAERALRHGEAGSIVLLVIAAVVLFSGFPWWWHGPVGHGFPWFLLVVAGLVWWFWAASRGRAPGGRHPGESPQQWGERVAERGRQWGEQAGERGRQWGEQAAERGAEWGERVGQQGARLTDPMTRPRAPRPPRRRSGGLLLAIVAIGLALIAYGAVQWAGTQYDLPGNHYSVAIAAALGAFGLLLVVVGLVGWRAGLVGFLAIVTAVITFASSVLPPDIALSAHVGDRRWTPVATATSTDGYSLGAGDAVLDLRRLPQDATDTGRIPVSLGVGDLRILVPDGLTTEVRAHVGAGEVVLPDSGDPLGAATSVGGANVTHRTTVGDGPTELVVDANVGIGQIHVEKE